MRLVATRFRLRRGQAPHAALVAGLLAGVATFGVAAAEQVSASAGTGTGSPAEASGPPRCIRDTGTHIRSRTAMRAAQQSTNGTKAAKACNGQPGSSYSADDIAGTGATNVAEALRLLDPAVH